MDFAKNHSAQAAGHGFGDRRHGGGGGDATTGGDAAAPRSRYCGWKKSCTTWDGRKPMNNGINHLLTGAGFLPSTV